MSTRARLFLVLVWAAAMVVPVSLIHALLNVDTNGFATLRLGEEKWDEYPGIGGIRRMVVYGDPTKPGPYLIRVKFSPGVMTRPHYHPEDRLVTVLKGTWYAGTGPEFDPERTEPFRAGGYMMHPAGAVHYDGARDDEVIVQIAGVGPSGTTFLKPELGPTGGAPKR